MTAPRQSTNEARAARGTATVDYYGREFVPEPSWYEDAVDAVADILHAYHLFNPNDPDESPKLLLVEAWDAFSREVASDGESRRLGLGEDTP